MSHDLSQPIRSEQLSEISTYIDSHKAKLFGMNFGRITKSGFGKNQCLFWSKLFWGGGV